MVTKTTMARPLRTFAICAAAPAEYPWALKARALPGRRNSRWHRLYSAAATMIPSTSAVVVGAGPGGITVIGNLLEHSKQLETRDKLVWVDPHFRGGRVNARYREVPSNTKVNLFVQFANAVAPFKHVVDTTSTPNAVTVLEGLPQDQGCRLSHAADMCLMLTEGLAKHPNLQQRQTEVASATLDEQSGVWTVGFKDGESITSSRIVLCTGSHPISKTLPGIEVSGQDMKPVDLDVALAPSILAKTLDPSVAATVAVIGASHSAILVLMNLVNLATSSHPHLRIKWFTRNKLRYAEYMDGWILRDNTGLKGQAADWARENLEDGTFPSSPVSEVVKQVWTAGREEDAYRAEMPGCTHIVQAVGYANSPLPRLEVVKTAGTAPEPLHIDYDNDSGRFYNASKSKSQAERTYVPGLFGAGIAFPERVTDPHGNVEYAVGFWKFMKFIKKVVPDWVGKP
ncbi:hypothetical protein F5Y16DRAFT_383634 [Xylariaceae sp. FL0255]|nr:hypothetical protein F5Y16DRAFT_383634 [Xylariaceae sp. FL0255]